MGARAASSGGSWLSISASSRPSSAEPASTVGGACSSSSTSTPLVSKPPDISARRTSPTDTSPDRRSESPEPGYDSERAYWEARSPILRYGKFLQAKGWWTMEREEELRKVMRKRAITALNDAEKVVKMAPKWGKGYARLGAAYYGLYEFRSAIAAYEKGLKAEPSLKALQDGLADTLKRQQQAGGEWTVYADGTRMVNTKVRDAGWIASPRDPQN